MSTLRPVMSRDEALVEAAGDGSLKAAGAVLALAAVGWLVHIALMLVTFLSLTYYGFSIGLNPTGVVAFTLTTLFAAVSASVSALLLSAVAFLLARGLRPVSWRDPDYGQVRTLSDDNDLQLALAGVAWIAFGALGLSLLFVMASPPEGTDAGALLSEVAFRWVIAAIVLVIAAMLQGPAYMQLVSLVRPGRRWGGDLFLTYSVTNLVGVLVLVGALAALFGGAAVRSEVQLWPLYLGTLLTFAIAPVVGALAFERVVWLAVGLLGAGTGSLARSAWFAPEWFHPRRNAAADGEQRPPTNPSQPRARPVPADGPDLARGSSPRDGVSPGTEHLSDSGHGGGTQLRWLQDRVEQERAILRQLDWRFVNGLISREVFDAFAEPRIRRIAELQADVDRFQAGSRPPPGARGNETGSSPK